MVALVGQQRNAACRGVIISPDDASVREITSLRCAILWHRVLRPLKTPKSPFGQHLIVPPNVDLITSIYASTAH